jgi:hypothetical protein
MTAHGAAGPNELDEWNAIAKKGASQRRKALVPVVAGALAFGIVFAAVFAAMSAFGAADYQDKQARLARGERVVEYVPRNSTKESRAASSGLFVFILAAFAGTAAATGAFLGLGGKLSSEYRRGFEQMGR